MHPKSVNYVSYDNNIFYKRTKFDILGNSLLPSSPPLLLQRSLSEYIITILCSTSAVIKSLVIKLLVLRVESSFHLHHHLLVVLWTLVSSCRIMNTHTSTSLRFIVWTILYAKIVLKRYVSAIVFFHYLIWFIFSPAGRVGAFGSILAQLM